MRRGFLQPAIFIKAAAHIFQGLHAVAGVINETLWRQDKAILIQDIHNLFEGARLAEFTPGHHDTGDLAMQWIGNFQFAVRQIFQQIEALIE